MAKLPIGLQLYTLRELLAQDFIGTLEKVAELGYDGVEFAGYGNLEASELKKVLDDLGLVAAGAHVPLDMLENELSAVIDYNLEIGNKFVSCPWVAEDRRQSASDWKRIAESLNRIGEETKRNGIQLLYHNHAFEFEKFDGKYALDILFENTDPDLVQAELDVYWVYRGGEDPAEYIKKYANRVPVVHLKDVADDEEKSFAEVGEGILNLPSIFAAAESSGAQWYIVEQDICKRPPLESVKISINNLRQMGK